MSTTFEQELRESLQIKIGNPRDYLDEVRKTGNDRMCALSRPKFKTKQYKLKISYRYGMANSISTNMPKTLAMAVTGIKEQYFVRTGTGWFISPSQHSIVRAAMDGLSIRPVVSGRTWDRTQARVWTIEERTPVMPSPSRLSVMYRARAKIQELEAACQG